MRPEPSSRPRAFRTAVAVGVSLCAHVLALALLRVPTPLEPDEVVITTLVEEPPEPEAVPEPEPDAVADAESEATEVSPEVTRPAEARPRPAPVVAVVVPPPPPPPPVPVQPAEPVPPRPLETLRSVAQQNRDAPPPEQAEYLSEFDNSTDVETMAEETTLFDEAPEPESASSEADEEESPGETGETEAILSRGIDPTESTDTPTDRAPEPVEGRPEAPATALGAPEGAEAALSPEASEERAEIVPDSDEGPADQAGHDTGERTTDAVDVVEGTGLAMLLPEIAVVQARAVAASQAAPVSRGDAHGVDTEAYVEVFGARDARERARVDEDARQASLVGDHGARWERTRASLENFDVHVTPGTETSLNTRSDAVAGYIHYLHNKIHPEWWDYLAHLDLAFGPMDPLSDLSLATLIEFGISRDGEVDTVNIVDGSGVLSFDAEAIDMLYEIGPHRAPPPGMISSDGRAYVLWTFHRDNRGCTTSGATAHRIQTTEGEDG